MDGLDTYIDDYSKPDPMPAAMLRQMAQSKFLGLFDDERATRPTGKPCHPEADRGMLRPARRRSPMKTLICDCNQTMPLDGPALRQALGDAERER